MLAYIIPQKLMKPIPKITFIDISIKTDNQILIPPI